MRSAHVIVFSMFLALGACDAARTGDEPAPAAEPTAPLNLDLSRDHMPVDDEVVEVGEEDNLLPDLVGNEAESGTVKLSGSVITNKEAPTLREKIDGAEVKLEVKTP